MCVCVSNLLMSKYGIATTPSWLSGTPSACVKYCSHKQSVGDVP